jgi:hypothetical protein
MTEARSALALMTIKRNGSIFVQYNMWLGHSLVCLWVRVSLSALRAFWQCNQYPQLRLLLHHNFERFFKRMISIKSHECTFASLDEVDYIVTHVDRLIYWHCGHAVSLEQCRGKVYYSLD